MKRALMGATAAIVVAAGTSGCPRPQPICGNGVCEVGETNACGDCGGGPVCGNGACEAGETAAGCPGDCGGGGPVCGNGACEAGETAGSCPADCGGGGPVCGNGACEAGETVGSCPVDCGGGGGCSSHLDCASTQICVGTSCTSAYGRGFWVGAYDAEFSTNDPACVCAWDPDGTAPDGYVEISVDGFLTGTTSIVTNNFYPIWDSGVDVILTTSTLVEMDVWDDDGVGDDYFLYVTVPSASIIDAVRTGGGFIDVCGAFTSTTDDWCFTVRVAPL